MSTCHLVLHPQLPERGAEGGEVGLLPGIVGGLNDLLGLGEEGVGDKVLAGPPVLAVRGGDLVMSGKIFSSFGELKQRRSFPWWTRLNLVGLTSQSKVKEPPLFNLSYVVTLLYQMESASTTTIF